MSLDSDDANETNDTPCLNPVMILDARHGVELLFLGSVPVAVLSD